MFVLSRNGEEIVNLERTFRLQCLEMAYTCHTSILASEPGRDIKVNLGMYGTFDRTKEVLREICDALEAGEVLFRMPEE